MRAEFAVQIVADIHGRSCERIGEPEQRPFGRGELIETVAQQVRDFFLAQTVDSAAGRIDVDSKRAADA